MQTYYSVSRLKMHNFVKRSLDTGTLLAWRMLLSRRRFLLNGDLIARCEIPLELFGQKSLQSSMGHCHCFWSCTIARWKEPMAENTLISGHREIRLELA